MLCVKLTLHNDAGAHESRRHGVLKDEAQGRDDMMSWCVSGDAVLARLAEILVCVRP